MQFERVKAMCVSLGEVLVRPLAEALSVEERPRTRERLTSILLAFGSVGRRTIERLKNSQNPAVRRTAIHLMRQFGGSDALPDLTELLDDSEPLVQREAVRAIVNVGTDAAYRILEQALTGGTIRSRDAIMQSIGLVRDERATALFAYILRHVDHRGALAPVYLRAIESLGALRDAGGIAPLRDALYKGGVVGAEADLHAAARRRCGAGAHRHAGRVRRARGGGGARQPGDPRRRARATVPAPGRAAPARGRGRAVTAPRFQLADELLRRFAASLRSAQLYSKGHPIISRNLETLSGAFQLLHSLQPAIVIGLVGDEVIVDDMPMAKADTLGPFVRPAAAERHRAHHHRSRRDHGGDHDVHRRRHQHRRAPAPRG
jgi:hypothetical protein